MSHQITPLFSMVWSPFYRIAPIIFQNKYQFSKVHSSRLIGFAEVIPIIIILIISPVVNRYGYKLLFVLPGCIVISFVHFSILFGKYNPYIYILLLGLSSPLIACYRPCVSKLISSENLATTHLALNPCLNKI
jgi:hypothetical protein